VGVTVNNDDVEGWVPLGQLIDDNTGTTGG
jgi:hypothetical protein